MTTSLLNLSDSCPSLSQIILTKHLGDLMAALIQLSFAPLKKPDGEGQKKEGTPPSFVMTQEKYDKFLKEQTYFKAQLDKLINRFEHQKRQILLFGSS